MADLGVIDRSPPGAPGDGITGIRAPEAGGVRFIPGSTPAGRDDDPAGAPEIGAAGSALRRHDRYAWPVRVWTAAALLG